MKISIDTKEDAKHLAKVINFLQSLSNEDIHTNFSETIKPEQTVASTTPDMFNMFDSKPEKEPESNSLGLEQF